MFKNLFDKCIKLAASKWANSSLATVSFIESSFFPIPPDVMIVPMVVAKKENYIKIFTYVRKMKFTQQPNYKYIDDILLSN